VITNENILYLTTSADSFAKDKGWLLDFFCTSNAGVDEYLLSEIVPESRTSLIPQNLNKFKGILFSKNFKYVVLNSPFMNPTCTAIINELVDLQIPVLLLKSHPKKLKSYQVLFAADLTKTGNRRACGILKELVASTRTKVFSLNVTDKMTCGIDELFCEQMILDELSKNDHFFFFDIGADSTKKIIDLTSYGRYDLLTIVASKGENGSFGSHTEAFIYGRKPDIPILIV